MVAASGTRPCVLSQAGSLSGDLRQKIFYEVAPIRECSDKHIVIVGAGDAAFDYALNLAQAPTNRITIIYRGHEIKALPLLHARCLKKDNIQLLERHEIVSIRKGEMQTFSLTVERPGGTTLIECDYILAAVGREGETSFFSPRLLDIEEALLVRGLLQLVGDVKNGLFRQASIAVGNGIEAAMRVCRAMKE